MTQSMFSTTEPAVPAPRAPEDVTTASVEMDESPDSHRKQVLAGVAAAVVLVAGGAGYLLLHSSGTPATPALVPTHHAHSAPPSGSFNASSFPSLPQAFSGPVGRDPFQPLVTPPVAASSGATGPTTTNVTNPVSTGAGTATSGATGSAPATGTGTTTTTAAAPDWIDLDSVAGGSTPTSATFFVHLTNGEVVVFQNVPAPPQGKATAFGPGFSLEGLQSGFAVVQFGSAPVFDVMQGYANRHMLD